MAADERPEVVAVVCDAARMARSLYLVRQLRETDQRLVVVLTMTDIAHRHGLRVDTDALAQVLGVPVVAVDPRHRRDKVAFVDAVTRALAAPAPTPVVAAPATDGPDLLALPDERFAWIETVVARSVRHEDDGRVRLSDRLDRVALSPVFGPVLFLAAMWGVFELTTTAAAPLQDALDWLFSGPITSGAQWLLDALGLGNTWVAGLVVSGLIAGVGMLLTFVPLMAIMFVLLALLEDSGYLARAAVVADRLMRAIGLPGRAFLPLIVGFGCNVPAVSATRILPHARQRALTALLVPFTSCSARLTVYVLVGSAFFGARSCLPAPPAGFVPFSCFVVLDLSDLAMIRFLPSNQRGALAGAPAAVSSSACCCVGSHAFIRLQRHPQACARGPSAPVPLRPRRSGGSRAAPSGRAGGCSRARSP